MNPRLQVCYCCGREYGSLSIEIHIPKCLEKWRTANNALPKSQRKPEPKRPQLQPDMAIKPGHSAAQALNAAAYESAANAQLVQCDNCKRRILPNQLPRHQRACRPGVDTFKRKASLKLPFKPLRFRRVTLSAKLRLGKPVALLPEVRAKKRTMIRNGQLALVQTPRATPAVPSRNAVQGTMRMVGGRMQGGTPMRAHDKMLGGLSSSRPLPGQNVPFRPPAVTHNGQTFGGSAPPIGNNAPFRPQQQTSRQSLGVGGPAPPVGNNAPFRPQQQTSRQGSLEQSASSKGVAQPCPRCGQRTTSDRYPMHVKMCKGL